MPKVIPLIQQAIRSASRNGQLILLLAIFCGLLTSLVYAPALQALDALMRAFSENTESTSAGQQALLIDAAPTLLLSQVAATVVMAFLLPLWARTEYPLPLAPWDHSLEHFIRRGTLGFLHLVTAGLLTILGILLFVLAAIVISGPSGGPGSLTMSLGVVSAVWLGIYLSAAANTAITMAATDQKCSFWQALSYNKKFTSPIIGTLATIWVCSLLASSLLEGLSSSLLSGNLAFRLSAFFHGTFGFLTTALHISVLCKIPGHFKTDTRA